MQSPQPTPPDPVGATGPATFPSEDDTITDPTSPLGFSAPPAENPVIGVPFVPSEPLAASAQ